MKRQKLAGLHLWCVGDRYYFLTRRKRVEDAIKKALKYGLSRVERIEYHGHIDG